MQVLLATSRAWYLGQTARALSDHGALAGLWMSDKNATGIPAGAYRRCWPYHLAMKPLYHGAPQIVEERASYALSGLWRAWVRARLRSPGCPQFDVAHAIMGFATEIFERAGQVRALKVLDCPNSHPTSYYGFWQRECDLWCRGEKVPIPRGMFARMNREIEQADVVLCPSQFVRDMMVLNGVDSAKCFINPFGVDTRTFTPRQQPPPTPRFLSVGTICLRKGHQYLFRASEKVRQRLPKAELICVGAYKCDFRRERPKWKGTFIHYPALPHAQLSELMRSCTAFVLPSCEEGLARVIPEAMAAGLPIIATYESGAPTLVTHGTEGLIVSRRPSEIAEAMVRLATDSNLTLRMGEAAWRRGTGRNTWQAYGDRLLVEYSRRLDGGCDKGFCGG